MTQPDLLPADAFAALAFLVDAGADEVIADEPVDRLRRLSPAGPARADSARPAPMSAAPTQAAPTQAAPTQAAPAIAIPAQPTATPEIVMAARSLANGAQTLSDLEAALKTFDGCDLKQTATRLVFADGRPGARLMIIGEAPGRDEDLEGRPFVGRSGQLLDRMLAAIGLDRTQVYIANVVPWRPPGNRKPSASEIAICKPFLERQIVLAAPELLLLLGGAATSALLDRQEGIMRLRGQFYEVGLGETSLPAFASFHPAYLLRAPGEKKLAWRDFLAVKARLGNG